MTLQAKLITIGQAEQSPSSQVFVMNTSGGNGQQKGIINFTVTEGNGRATVVRIPVTFIPLDLTESATKNAILSSPDFRRLVSKGIISLIADKDAEALLNNEPAQKEKRRLLDINHSLELDVNQQSVEVQSMKAEAAGQIGGFAMSLAHTIDGEEDALCSNLRNNADVLTQAELKYIVDNSTFHKVKTLAAEYIVR
jgi:hypothetical protein